MCQLMLFFLPTWCLVLSSMARLEILFSLVSLLAIYWSTTSARFNTFSLFFFQKLRVQVQVTFYMSMSYLKYFKMMTFSLFMVDRLCLYSINFLNVYLTFIFVSEIAMKFAHLVLFNCFVIHMWPTALRKK